MQALHFTFFLCSVACKYLPSLFLFFIFLLSLYHFYLLFLYCVPKSFIVLLHVLLHVLHSFPSSCLLHVLLYAISYEVISLIVYLLFIFFYLDLFLQMKSLSLLLLLGLVAYAFAGCNPTFRPITRQDDYWVDDGAGGYWLDYYNLQMYNYEICDISSK